MTTNTVDTGAIWASNLSVNVGKDELKLVTQEAAQNPLHSFRLAFAVKLLWLLPLIGWPAGAQAQFTFATNNGAITISRYTGSGGAVLIPGTANGLPVTSIGTNAFYFCTNLTSIVIPNSVTSIGTAAFYYCTSLTNVTIGNGVTSIGTATFDDCTSLTSITICNGVASIGTSAFWDCFNLTSVTIPGSVTSIGSSSFHYCTNLASIYFTGNAPTPANDSSVFPGDNNGTVYYLPGTTGWGTVFDGRPTRLWNPQVQTKSATFGVRTNQFGFNITGTSGLVIVVEACTNLVNPVWQPVSTNTLAGGSSYFDDPQWMNYHGRFYRLRSP
jgi:hypothetical protein